MESIRKTIQINNISPEVLTRKTFGKTVFIIDAVPVDENDRFTKYGSLSEVSDGTGSNSEATLFAKSYFVNGAYGTTPPFMYVYKIDITAGGEDLGEKVDELLVKTDDFYFITSDENFTTAQKQVISEKVEAYADNWYMVTHEETSADAYDTGVTTDISSVLGALNYEKTFCNYSQQPSGNNQYLTGAVCGEMSGVEYTSTQGKYQPAKKSLSGILVNGLTDSNLTKLQDKNYNYYTATTTIADNDWYGLNSRNVNGNSFIDQIAVDYMSYELTVSLAELLKNTSIIGFDQPGYDLIDDTLNRKCLQFLAGDILAEGGVTSDGELFPNGFKVIMPNLADATPTQKVNGDLTGIVIYILPKFSVTKITITLNGRI